MEYPNWFNNSAKDNFEKFLIPLAGQQNLNFLQVGTFTGDASVWMLDNVLTDVSSTLYDVDTWQGSNENAHKDMNFEDVFNTYLKKTNSKTMYYKGKSIDYFMSRSQFGPQVQYDFIYIDGDHTAQGVITDATMAFHYLKPGGILAFDDYTWTSDDNNELHTPKPAINFFYWAYQKELQLLISNTQFWVRKI